MNIALWILQGLLAVAMLGAGGMKLVTPKAKLVANPQMAWAADFGEGQIKLIGLSELLGAVGLVLPWALGIVPVLTAVAAACLLVIMAGAAWTHIRRKEPAIVPIVLAVLLAVVAAGRLAL
jgi:hypothetical protein